MTMNDEVAEALSSAPEPTPPVPHGVPSAPVVHLGAPTAAELRRLAEQQEARERAAAAARQAAEDEYKRQRRECAQIAAETKPVYDAIASIVDAVLKGFGSLAAKLEAAEAAAMERGRAIAGQEGAAEVQGHLRSTRAERLRPFLELLRDDNPTGDRQ